MQHIPLECRYYCVNFMEKHVMKKALFTLAAVLGLVLTVAPVNAQENREFRGGDFRMGIGKNRR